MIRGESDPDRMDARLSELADMPRLSPRLIATTCRPRTCHLSRKDMFRENCLEYRKVDPANPVAGKVDPANPVAGKVDPANARGFK